MVTAAPCQISVRVVSADGRLVGEFGEIGGDSVLQRLMCIGEDAGIGVCTACDRVDILGIGAQGRDRAG